MSEIVISDEQLDFLERVAAGRRLPLADRKQDRVRQKCRRDGLAEVLMNPRRWVITDLGADALSMYSPQRGDW